MIPPTQDVRLRSISRWLKDSNPKEFKRLSESGELASHAQQLDDAMIEDYQAAEDSLTSRLMQSKEWGTEAGLQKFSSGKLELWQQTVADHLPPISDPQ